MLNGYHHFHRRKRIHLKHEKYPHPNKWKRLIDKISQAVGWRQRLLTAKIKPGQKNGQDNNNFRNKFNHKILLF